MQYIIYGLRCPKTDSYRYIGKSSSGIKRAKSHLIYSHSQSVNKWVSDLRDKGLCPLIDVIEPCPTQESLIEREKFWIKFYEDAGCELLNVYIYKSDYIAELTEEVDIAQYNLEKALKKANDELVQVSTLRGFIRNRRKSLNLKQKDLAELAGITQRTLTDIELGKGNPSYTTIEKLLDILGYKLVPTLKTNNL
jgi:DNA-binding XRE family transcriptional regulator